ncbi:MAG: GreA/GreB family elongation factor [Kiritimatiellae bacterium]|nr:GreA/GreB family elongation factor [Kiritimatiellia bacterium]
MKNDVNMTTAVSPQNLPDTALEEWFLNRLPETKNCFRQLLEAILRFAGKNQTDKAEACAELLEDALMKIQAGDELILLLAERAAWQTDPDAYASACAAVLKETFRGQSFMPAFLEESGFFSGKEPKEALRRLRVLRKLLPGKCCYEKTWGLGIISGIDEFDRKLVIDFENKRAHRLAFGYAAESVRPLEEDHFLARKLRDPANFAQWVKNNPAAAVKAVIAEFGEMNLPQLRVLTTSLIISENEWSSFWAAARAELARDPLIRMPAGRNGPLKIMVETKEFDNCWLRDFLALRDGDRILEELDILGRKIPPHSLDKEMKEAAADRLKYVIRGAAADRRDLVVRALLFAAAAGLDDDAFHSALYSGREFLASALSSLPVRLIRPFLEYLRENSPAAAETLLQIMPCLPVSALGEVVLHFRQHNRQEQAYEKLRVFIREGKTGVDMVLWMGRDLQEDGGAHVCQPEVFARIALDALQQAAAAGKRKETGQLLRNIFTDQALAKKMLQSLAAAARLDYVQRFKSISGLTGADKTRVAAKIIPLFPELAAVFGAPPSGAVHQKITSWRVYRERQAQLEKIIKEEIPRNSMEIGTARSYGDLRENYEYKAAKEMQGLLMRRKAELEQMLSEVRGADFAGFPHEAAGPGTAVELKIPDGNRQVYHILGEWDSDEKLGIISCRSKLAEVLTGRRAGDSVEIPGEKQPVRAVIGAVRSLPPEIMAWINGG